VGGRDRRWSRWQVGMKRAWFLGAAGIVGCSLVVACARKREPGPTATVRDAAVTGAPGMADAALGAATPAHRGALAKGRGRAKASDWAAAVPLFEGATRAAPGDAVAESELGWALFHAGELPRAEQVTRASIAHASAPRVKAASHYNLGRIREARGDAPAAAD